MPPRQVCLGVTLGNRHVGLAVTTREHLLHDSVLNLHKLVSDQAKEARFSQVIWKHIETYGVTRVACVRLARRPPGILTDTLRMQLARTATDKRVGMHHYKAEDIRRIISGAEQPQGRGLVDVLVEQFPELRHRVPDPAKNVALRTSRERYWTWMFLALGAAVHDLEVELKARLTADL